MKPTIPGFKSISQFARSVELPTATVRCQIAKGYCQWPKKYTQSLGGHPSIAAFARAWNLNPGTVIDQLHRGYCAWPQRKADYITTHSHYSTWEGMIQRCTNPNSKKYKIYGGRGITVYPAWREPRVFLDYLDIVLGIKPTAQHTIDRIDNNKGYEPGNIRWVTKSEQNLNRRARK